VKEAQISNQAALVETMWSQFNPNNVYFHRSNFNTILPIPLPSNSLFREYFLQESTLFPKCTVNPIQPTSCN